DDHGRLLIRWRHWRSDGNEGRDPPDSQHPPQPETQSFHRPSPPPGPRERRSPRFYTPPRTEGNRSAPALLLRPFRPPQNAVACPGPRGPRVLPWAGFRRPFRPLWVDPAAWPHGHLGRPQRGRGQAVLTVSAWGRCRNRIRAGVGRLDRGGGRGRRALD